MLQETREIAIIYHKYIIFFNRRYILKVIKEKMTPTSQIYLGMENQEETQLSLDMMHNIV